MVLEAVKMRVRGEGSMVKLEFEKGKDRINLLIPWDEARTFFRAGLNASVEAERIAKFSP